MNEFLKVFASVKSGEFVVHISAQDRSAAQGKNRAVQHEPKPVKLDTPL